MSTLYVLFFFFKQKTAYEIKECDWSSDVCSSDLDFLNSTDLPVVAVDLPSGLEASTGKVEGSCIQAEIGRASCRERV